MIHMTATEKRAEGWRAFCRCPWRSEFVTTQDEARDLGDAHLAEANA